MSNLNLLEYSFVMKKANEDSQKIRDSLKLFSNFTQNEDEKLNNKLLLCLNDDYSFKNSFDLYHIVFAQTYQCEKIITFDKGFKKFRNKYEIEIEILEN